MMNMMSPTPSKTSVLSSIIATCIGVLQKLGCFCITAFTSSNALPSNFQSKRVACTINSYNNSMRNTILQTEAPAPLLAPTVRDQPQNHRPCTTCYKNSPREERDAHVVEQGVAGTIDNKERVDAARDKHGHAGHWNMKMTQWGGVEVNGFEMKR